MKTCRLRVRTLVLKDGGRQPVMFLAIREKGKRARAVMAMSQKRGAYRPVFSDFTQREKTAMLEFSHHVAENF